MIPPREQWCVQIEATSHCPRSCSNCTRLLSHVHTPYHMPPADFRRACEAVADFPAESPPDLFRRLKVIGIMGGEPLTHPDFPALVDIACEVVPDRRFRGLWTGLDWTRHKHRAAVEKLLGPNPSLDVGKTRAAGYLNDNRHDTECRHQPVLIASSDVVHDDNRLRRLLDACWLQQQWASSINPKGFYACEVAAAVCLVMDGPDGLPVTPGCWRHDLADYRYQFEWACPRCSIALPLPPRIDKEGIDDISPSNLDRLRRLGSPRVAAGHFWLRTAEYTEEEEAAERAKGWMAHRYRR